MDCSICKYGNRPLYMEPCGSCRLCNHWEPANQEEDTLISTLYEMADWAQSNVYEVPIILPDVLQKAAQLLEEKEKEIKEIEIMDR